MNQELHFFYTNIPFPTCANLILTDYDLINLKCMLTTKREKLTLNEERKSAHSVHTI